MTDWHNALILSLAVALAACDGEDSRTQAELLDDVCSMFLACDNPDCGLGMRAEGLAPCADFREALLALDAVLVSDGCGPDACAGGRCSFDEAYGRASQAEAVCALDPGRAPFPEDRGYRCGDCLTNDRVELCGSGYAGYLHEDIVYSGAYGIDGSMLTLVLDQLDQPLEMVLEEDGTLTWDGATFTRDDTVDLVDCL